MFATPTSEKYRAHGLVASAAMTDDASPDRPVRWGVLSTSGFAERTFIPGLRKSPIIEVAAVASRSAERAEAFAQRCSIPAAYATYEDLLADPTIEVIYNPLSGVRNGVPNMVSVDRRYDYSRSKKAVLKKTEGAYTLLNWSVDSTGRPVPGSRYKAIDKSFCADGSIFETVAQTVEIDGGGGVAGTTDYTRTPGNTTNCIW